MPRQKLTPKKRKSDETIPTQPKRSKTTGRRRRTLLSVDPNIIVLGSLHIPWNPPDNVTYPPTLEFDATDSKVSVDNIVLDIPPNVSQALRDRNVSMVCKVEDSSPNELCLHLGVQLPFQNARLLVEALYNKDYSEYCDNPPVVDASQWGQFFKELERIQRLRPPPAMDFQHVDLVPTLRGYQNAAVGWMMARENSPGDLDLSWLTEVTDNLETETGDLVLYAKYAGAIYPSVSTTPTCSGGILADEMGLGKTVITLALVLNNRRNECEEWQLAVSPSKISKSWDSLDCDGRERARNQENSLDANEELQLVTSKIAKGVLRSKLNAWYESKLSEMSPVRNRPEKRQIIFKCVCGDLPGKKKNTITCECCGLIQHRKCCGYVGKTYVCPSCWKQQATYPSRATLIIVPPAIFEQWASEIERHTPNLKIMQYKGVKEGFVQPSHMADHDLVVTTYTVLRGEWIYAEEGNSRTMRNHGRFLRSSSPLESVAWWRIICDEAQMVESDMSVVRAMTQRLIATHRWCVTGTPIQKSVADLYYLTSFMGLGAFDDKNMWTDLLLKPYLAGCKSPLLSVIQQVFWRSTKDHVNDELELPDQSFKSHILKFTAIEESFYMQEHARSADSFAMSLSKSGVALNRTIDSVDKGTLKKLLQPLLNIRQACTHPQVVSGINITCASNAANLGELLTYLIKKTKQDCEESLRRHVAALNGLAGLCCLQDDFPTAIDNYRAVLRLAEEYKSDEARIDPLQRIHALFNAAEILENNPGCAPPTLRDGNLKSDVAELEKKYVMKAEEIFNTSRTLAASSSKEVDALVEKFESKPGAWWVPVVLGFGEMESELIDKLQETLDSIDHVHKIKAKNFLNQVSCISGIQMTIKQWWGALEKHHNSVRSGMSTLMECPCELLVEEALGCHLRTDPVKNSCAMCKMERKMQNLECELFDTTKKEIHEREKVIDGALTKGSWKPSYPERTLNIILSFARGKIALDKWSVRDGKRHSRLLEAMKKEFKQTRAAWTALNHRVHAEDELTMAKIRLRLAQSWETPRRPNILALSDPNIKKKDTMYLIRDFEVPVLMQEFTADRDASFSDFKKKLGKLLYLQNLAKDRNVTPDPCPVCKSQLNQQWCVLNCGHCYCIDCLQMLHDKSAKRVKCPVCREMTESSTVGFVDTSDVYSPDDDITVTGDFSTKVDNIVREALRLVAEDSSVKILIFSTWAEVLKILKHALELNHVSFRALPSGKHQEILKEFRDPDSGISALLLPLAWGSKGLNLVEATHVFLVEPILNPSEELQAIGRIHRIGQTKPTFVHRFIIKRTVEEMIFSTVSEAQDTWSNQKVSFSDLQRLFAIPRQEMIGNE